MKGKGTILKKTISLLLAIYFFFSCIFLSCATNEETIAEESPAFNLCSTLELSTDLKKRGLDTNDIEAYNVYLLIQVADPSKNIFHTSDLSSDSSNTDILLKEHHERVANYYSSHNENIAITLGLDEYNYYASFYAPYIEIVFDDLWEYEKHEQDILTSLGKNEMLISAVSNYAVFESSAEATIDTDLYTTNYPLTNAYDDIGVSNALYTGNGIKVGVLDSGIPDIIDNLKPDKYTKLSTIADRHSTVVTSIIGGTSGIAEDVHFFCKRYSGINNNSLISDFDKLIREYHVNIINMSLGYEMVGYYMSYDACIDNIISNTGCVVVKSAGNTGEGNSNITAPGCSMNAITVGSINRDHNLSYFSSWNVSDNFLFKPDVVAPGERLWSIPNLPDRDVEDDEDNGYSGTSYSAPMVTGTIALLMEEFPDLKTNPALVKSVLHLGAQQLPSQTEYFDQQAGFGLINYPKMREYLSNLNYETFSISPTDTANTVVLSKTVTLSHYDKIFINANLIVNSSVEGSESVITLPVYTDYTIKIYNVGTSTYAAESTIDSSVDYLSYTNMNTTNSTFRIDIVLDSNSVSEQSESGAIAYEIITHTHSFNNYTYLNARLHKRVCRGCGMIQTEGHFVYADEIVGGRYATCGGCNRELDLTVDLPTIIMSATQVSVNGSYILPNGIVVLVDEDVEAYLAGTLQFYHPDDLPVTE